MVQTRSHSHVLKDGLDGLVTQSVCFMTAPTGDHYIASGGEEGKLRLSLIDQDVRCLLLLED